MSDQLQTEYHLYMKIQANKNSENNKHFQVNDTINLKI